MELLPVFGYKGVAKNKRLLTLLRFECSLIILLNTDLFYFDAMRYCVQFENHAIEIAFIRVKVMS